MTNPCLSRRVFLQSLCGAAVSSVSPILSASAPSAQDPVLVQLFLKGGMDSLSALVPYEEGTYFDQRPTTAIKMRGSLLKKQRLDERFALHPGLSALKPLYKKNHLAFVVAAGLPQVQRSHFDAQDICESGGGSQIQRSGWMARALSSSPAQQFDAFSIGGSASRSLAEHESALVVPGLDHFSLPGSDSERRHFETGLLGMYKAREPSSGQTALRLNADLEKIRQNYRGPQHGAKYGSGSLKGDLRTLAELIRETPSLKMATVSLGGWDTHRAQGSTDGPLAKRFAQLGKNLAAFVRDLGPERKRVVVVVMTEFGRTVRENGTQGTDHGYGSMMMIYGESVRGGMIHGAWPGLRLRDLTDGRDLPVTTDYRRVLEELRVGHLGLPPNESPFDFGELAPPGTGGLLQAKSSPPLDT